MRDHGDKKYAWQRFTGARSGTCLDVAAFAALVTRTI